MKLNAWKTFVVIACLSTASMGIIGMTGCASGDRTHETTGEDINDSMISSHVAAALAASSDYKFEDVHVATFKGRVQLSGFADSGAHKDQAAMIARQVEGVKDVVNNITVK